MAQAKALSSVAAATFGCPSDAASFALATAELADLVARDFEWLLQDNPEYEYCACC
jgi:hypothetical protein